jgi:lysophospholipase L1-like esterase
VKWLAGVVAILMAGGVAHAQSAWREAFQSSPATYEAPSDQLVKFAARRRRMPVEVLRADLTPEPVNGTVRYRVTVQAAGSQLRIRLSNEEGVAPLRLAAASVGVAAEGFAAQPGSLRALTFGGVSNVNLAAGVAMISDPVSVKVKPGTELVVSAALVSPMANEGRGGAGFVRADGSQAMQTVLDHPTPMKGRPLVSGVQVLANPAPRVIVAMGDSITDGNRAELGKLHGWPERLAQRLAKRKEGRPYSVVNAGIAGNRLLTRGWGAAGLARLDRDVLRIEGVSHLILLEGINDINMSGRGLFGTSSDISAEELITGYRQVIARAHERGIKVYIGTLTPNHADKLSTPAKVAVRDAVNRWIRTSGEPDEVIDFDAMVRDPAAPTRFKAEFDSGDHLHPSDLGYAAMGDGIDLRFFL